MVTVANSVSYNIPTSQSVLTHNTTSRRALWIRPPEASRSPQFLHPPPVGKADSLVTVANSVSDNILGPHVARSVFNGSNGRTYERPRAREILHLRGKLHAWFKAPLCEPSNLCNRRVRMAPPGPRAFSVATQPVSQGATEPAFIVDLVDSTPAIREPSHRTRKRHSLRS